MSKLDVLVVGATGRQGGAVARALLQAGHGVRALTRNLAHPAAGALRQRGARLAWAELGDLRRLEGEARGVHAIFAVTAPLLPAGTESTHGLHIAEVARQLGVPHLVYSSSVRARARTGLAEHDSKHEIEQYLRAARVPHTVVCPAFFMENYLTPQLLGTLRHGRLALPLAPGSKLEQTALSDFARFVRVVLEQRDAFLGRRVCIASDALTPIETAATLARATGRPIEHDLDAAAANTAAGALYDHIDVHGTPADVAALRRQYPEVNWHTLDGWARTQDWTVLAPRRPL